MEKSFQETFYGKRKMLRFELLPLLDGKSLFKLALTCKTIYNIIDCNNNDEKELHFVNMLKQQKVDESLYDESILCLKDFGQVFIKHQLYLSLASTNFDTKFK